VHRIADKSGSRCASSSEALGDVAENRDFISLSHEMEMPMAEIARHVGYVDQLSLRQFKRWSQRIKIHRFHQRPPHPLSTSPTSFIRPVYNFEDDSKGFEKIERPIDGG